MSTGLLESIAPSLSLLGWDEERTHEFAPYAAEGLIPARVAIQHRVAFDLLTDASFLPDHDGADGTLAELRATAPGRLSKKGENSKLPVVGDWVAVELERGLVAAVLERRTAISRKEAWHASREQVLAANVDFALLVQGLPLDFNPRRLERYLAMSHESGATPAVLLNKADLVSTADLADYLEQARALTDATVLAISTVDGRGLEELAELLGAPPAKTAVLLGSSGAGKSTLVNALADTDIATQEIRERDGRGRHTTTRRELVVLPSGGVILDTPGIRELQLWEGDLEAAFSDIEELALTCRFNDCAHQGEPGCAINAALTDGSLDRARWDSYRELAEELAELERRREARAAAESRRSTGRRGHKR